jgi:selenium metabolism protein YedF
MSVLIDARGLPCPQPVIRTRAAMLGDADAVTTLVSAADQVDNLRRLAEKAGWSVTVAPAEDGYAVHLARGEQTAAPELTPDVTACSLSAEAAAGLAPAPLLLVASEQMGRGSDELGAILMRAFFHTLTETSPLPAMAIFYNGGVKLACQGSPVLDDLKTLEAAGVEILACGTCLGFFDLKAQLAVGRISNMYEIAEALLNAPRVVAP